MDRLTEGKCLKCGRLSRVRQLHTIYGEGKHAYICADCADKLPAIKVIFIPLQDGLRNTVVDTSWKNAKNKITELRKKCDCGNLKKPHLPRCRRCELARRPRPLRRTEDTEYDKGYSTGQMDHSAGCRIEYICNRHPYEPVTEYARGYLDGWNSVVWLETAT